MILKLTGVKVRQKIVIKVRGTHTNIASNLNAMNENKNQIGSLNICFFGYLVIRLWCIGLMKIPCKWMFITVSGSQ